MKDKDYNKKPCPFIKYSYEFCYCTNMGSQDINNVLYYCGEHFCECRFYIDLCSSSKKKVVCNP